MSLKAKLEAVIYAAEEPVTLAQLAALFAADALDWKAEQESARAEEAAEAAADALESQPLLTGSTGLLDQELNSDSGLESNLDPLGLEQSPAIYSGSESEPAVEEPAATEETAPGLERKFESAPESREESTAAESALAADAPDADAPAVETPSADAASLDAETEAKRQVRLRDREVRSILRGLLDELIASYAADARGVEIREIAGGYRMATKPECHDAVRLFIKSLKPVLKLSLPALETLAVIAYKQPVTAPEVNEIRGVESGGVLGSLLSRKLISTAGRKQVIGRPILYKTTKEFLLRFGLKDLAELPSMEEFEKIAAIELTETEAEEAANENAGGPAVPGAPEFEENAAEDDTPDQTPAADAAEPALEAMHAGPEPAETETPTHD